MATPTLSLAATTTTTATHLPSTKSSSKISSKFSKSSSLSSSSSKDLDSIISDNNNRSSFIQMKHQTTSMLGSNVIESQQQTSPQQPSSRTRRHITEEINDDSIYSIHLKKITYTFNNVLNKQSSSFNNNCNYVTRCDQVDYCSSPKDSHNHGNNNDKNINNTSKWNDDQQSLQWETRQLRTIKAATIEHLIQYILLLTPYQQQQAHLNSKPNSSIGHNNNNSNNNHRQKQQQSEQQQPESDDEDESLIESSYLLEERNNVAHAMHVLFATYRQFVYPWQLFTEIIRQKPFSSIKQFNFILFYWLNNYPEDFWTSCQPTNTSFHGGNGSPNNNDTNNHNNNNVSKIEKDDDELSSTTSSLFSDYATTTATTNSSLLSNQNYGSSSSAASSSLSSSINSSSSSTSSTSSSLLSQFSPLTLADQLISMRHIDEEVKKHCLHLLDMKKDNNNNNFNTLNHSSIHKTISKSSSITELDAKFIAQQLTAIDLENFLALKPYTLLSHQRSKTKIEIMIRNFNLLSRHVIVTILQHSTPHLVTIHWIEIAHHLRKMRNFNSLKAIIAGLTNESIHRLKSIIWNKLPRSSLSTFTYLSSIVDDVNNQTLLRHTQLFIEGTSKVSSLEESFGTVPYLGTFLTDITMINTRYDNYIKLENGIKLINFEKCCKQYEVLMQMQLLQKNAIAALQQQQQQQQNYHLEPIYSLNHYLSLRSQSLPSIPRVARIFRNWFQMNESDLPSDRECYQISLSIENPNGTKNKK